MLIERLAGKRGAMSEPLSLEYKGQYGQASDVTLR